MEKKILFANTLKALVFTVVGGLLPVNAYAAVDCTCDAVYCSNGDGKRIPSSTFDRSQCYSINGEPYIQLHYPETDSVTDQPTEVQIMFERDTYNDLKQLALEASANRGKDNLEKLTEINTQRMRSYMLENTGQEGTTRYVSSDLPEWDFVVSASGGVRESKLALATGDERESDVRTLGMQLYGKKDGFTIEGSFQYVGFQGSGSTDGVDTDEYRIGLMAGYDLFTQNENGIDISVYGLLEYVDEDYGDIGDQTRYVPSIGFTAGGWTPFGHLLFTYLFSHDHNTDNDLDVTGEEYINLHGASLNYTVPITRTLLCSLGTSYMYMVDIPDGYDDNSADMELALHYYGIENANISLAYTKSFDGYEHQGINLLLGYQW